MLRFRSQTLCENHDLLSILHFVNIVTISAALLFIYWCLLPAILTSAVWFRRRHVSSDIEGSTDEDDFEFSSLFTELLAIYGYSMVAFIPAAVRPPFCLYSNSVFFFFLLKLLISLAFCYRCFSAYQPVIYNGP